MALFSQNGSASRFTLPVAPPRPVSPPAPVLPAELMIGGALAVYTGQGRVTGGHVYCDLTTRRFHDVYAARVVRRYPRYVLAEVPGNTALGLICVPDSAGGGPTVNGWLLIGELRYPHDGGMPTAGAAWVLGSNRGEETTTGTVDEAHPTKPFGWINGDDGRRLFVHESELAPGLILRPGTRVRFTVTTNREGWKAVNVRLA
jgi:cold shock CspA family protein